MYECVHACIRLFAKQFDHILPMEIEIYQMVNREPHYGFI